MSAVVSIDSFAPSWAQNMVNSINAAFASQGTMFISQNTFVVSHLNAALAAQYPGKLALVSNGTGNRWIARSNGTAFYYADGTAV